MSWTYPCITWNSIGPASAMISRTTSDRGLPGTASFSVSLVIYVETVIDPGLLFDQGQPRFHHFDITAVNGSKIARACVVGGFSLASHTVVLPRIAPVSGHLGHQDRTCVGHPVYQAGAGGVTGPGFTLNCPFPGSDAGPSGNRHQHRQRQVRENIGHAQLTPVAAAIGMNLVAGEKLKVALMQHAGGHR